MDVAAEMPGVHLLWHRVALRRDAGKTDIHRPGYTHVLAFGPGKPGKAHPDVLPPGARTWKNGVAYNVATMVAEYLAGQGATTMLNPFCGEGTFLRAAVSAGLLARGCDLDPDRVATAMAQATLL